MTWQPRLATVATTIALLALGACGGADVAQPPTPSTTAGGPPVATGSPATSPAASSPSAPPTQNSARAFCAQLKTQGATGASFGPIPTFYPRELLLKDVRGKLADMGDVTPPKKIATQWQLQKTQLKKVESAAKKMRSDRGLDPALAGSDQVSKAQDILTDYWFDNCA